MQSYKQFCADKRLPTASAQAHREYDRYISQLAAAKAQADKIQGST